MRRMTTCLLILPSILLLSLFSIGNPVSAASGPQNIIMTNMHIHVELGSDCSSTVLIDANVTNTGLSDLSSFDMRIDVRGLEVISASLNGLTTNTSVSSVDNYVLLTVLSSTPISSGLSIMLNENVGSKLAYWAP